MSKEKYKTFQHIKTYEDLLAFLRHWKSFSDHEVYDFGGIIHIMLACLDNIKEFAVDGEIEDITNFLDNDQKQFLQKLAELSKRPVEE